MARNLKKRFEVHKVQEDQRVPRTVSLWVKGKGFTHKKVKDDRPQYMVYLPNGSSFCVRGDEELARLGLAGSAPLIDMDTGDIVEHQDGGSLKDRSVRATKPLRDAFSRGEASTT